MALEALQRIGRLYQNSKLNLSVLNSVKPGVRNTAKSNRLTYPGLLKIRPGIAPGSSSAKAINYILKRWPALCRYAETGHLPIGNNPVDNSIRPIAIGKKNWLFAGERAGQRARLNSTESTQPLGSKIPWKNYPLGPIAELTSYYRWQKWTRWMTSGSGYFGRIQRKILNALSGCAWFVLVASEAAIKSKWVRFGIAAIKFESLSECSF
jgi:hypothetical protein